MEKVDKDYVKARISRDNVTCLKLSESVLIVDCQRNLFLVSYNQ